MSQGKPTQIRAILALTKASLLSTFRNPSAVFFSFAFPFIFIIVFGLLAQGSSAIDIGVRQNSDKSGIFYETLDKLSQDNGDKKKIVNLITDKTDDELNDQLKKGQIPLVINLHKKGDVNVVDQTVGVYDLTVERSAASQSSQSAETIVNSITESINNPDDPSRVKLINTNVVTVEGRKYTQIDFILPGQLSFALLMSAMNGIAFSFIALRKELVIKRIFATPTSKSSIILSEILSKIVLAVLQSLLIITVGNIFFGFTLANGIWTLLSMITLAIIGLLVFLGFGLLVTTFGNDEDAIAPAANLISMPQLFLSGSFFPIDAFPSFLQPIARILPMTFLNDAMRKVAFEGVPLSDTLPQILGLIVWGILIYIIVVRLFKWE
ncbi:MAG: ABC transporter permease [Candidatus Dojkabacteria bacterium]